ncbi:MAG: GAF domain-containing protein [Candidatus Sericytochromatia bacterium]|nr:GAF domain-containing protein [Candidatus Sericytochromatia bacterium]
MHLTVIVGGTALYLVLLLIGIWTDLDRPFSGFYLTPWSTVGSIQATAHGEAGPAADDRLVEIDGAAVSLPDGYWTRIEQHAIAGTSPLYTFSRQGRLYRMRLETRPLSDIILARSIGPMVLAGLIYWLVGYIIYRTRPDLEAAQAFIVFANLSAMTLAGYADFNLHHRLILMYLAAFGLLGGLIVRLGLVFPQRLPIAEWAWTLRLPLVISIVLTVPLLALTVASRLSLWADALIWAGAWSTTVAVWVTACLTLGLGLFAMQALYGDSLARRQLVLVSMGALFGWMPIVLLTLLPRQFGWSPILSVSTGVLLSVSFPLSLAVAILRYGLWDVRMMLRQSISYVALVLLLGMLYFGILGILEVTYLTSHDQGRWAEFLAGVTIAAIFAPLRDYVHRATATFFFRMPYDPQAVLEQTAQLLATTLDMDRIAEQVMDVVNQTMHPVGGCLLVLDDQSQRYEPVHAFGLGPSLTLSADSPLVQAALAGRQTGSRSAVATPRLYLLQPLLREIGAELLIPLIYEENLLGMLLLGTKRAENAYNDTDLGLLRALAGQAALALHNARQVFTVRQINQRLEQMVTERTKALEEALAELQGTQARLVQSEKMVSLGLLVAGVAHEINNPAAVVIGNLELMKEVNLDVRRLLDSLDGLELSSHMAEMIAAVKVDIKYPLILSELEAMTRDCADAAKRIRSIVADLRTFSRPRGDGPLSPIDVRQGLQTTLNLVRSLFKERITLQADLAEAPFILGDASQLNQVFMNLLVNGAQAIPTAMRGSVDVALWCDADWLYFSVTDNGMGIPPENLQRLFDPFFTTKRQGEGMGLGLSISYGIVARHGGRIDVTSTVGEGSTFVVVLPVFSTILREGMTAKMMRSE